MSDTRTPEEIREDIEHTREELADTAAELAQRADVKARAHEKVEETKGDAREKVDETKAKVSHKVEDAKANPRPGVLIAAGAAGLVVAWLVFRRR